MTSRTDRKTGISAPRGAGAAGILRRGYRQAVDLLLPPRCLSCGAIATDDAGLCPKCWPSVDFISAPICACCGLPFEFAVEDRTLCGACAAEPQAFDCARAVFRYDDRSRDLILGFKHADKLHGAPAMARWMASSGSELIAASDIILPTPLHWRRLFARRYNQAQILASALSKTCGLPVAPDALVRKRPTPSQGHLTRKQRQRNVSGAFAVPPRRRHLVHGKRILIVDDVMTTGATLDAACKAVRRAGATQVRALVLARVVHPITLD